MRGELEGRLNDLEALALDYLRGPVEGNMAAIQCDECLLRVIVTGPPGDVKAVLANAAQGWQRTGQRDLCTRCAYRESL